MVTDMKDKQSGKIVKFLMKQLKKTSFTDRFFKQIVANITPSSPYPAKF